MKNIKNIDKIENLILTINSYKDIIIFTDSDLDGTGCRILLEWYFEELNIEKYYIIQTSIGRIEKDFEEQSKYSFHTLLATANKNCLFIFADLVPDIDVVNQLREKSNVWIFDHHLTSKELIEDFETYFYDVDYSACRIIYECFQSNMKYNKVSDEFSQLVNIYDLWEMDNLLFDDAKGLHNILFNLRRKYKNNNIFVNKQKRKFHLLDRFLFLPNEQIIVDDENKKEIILLNECRNKLKIRTDSKNNEYGYFECNKKISIMCSHLLRENKNLKYIVCKNTFVKNENKLSIRSIDSEVKSIGEIWGGGGHTYAAGFTMSDEMMNLFKSGEIHLI